MLEPISYFVCSLIISSCITFFFIKHVSFTKKGMYKTILISHLEHIKSELNRIKKLPYEYNIETSNEFSDQLATDITLKLKRKGFKVLRSTVVGISEKLVIS